MFPDCPSHNSNPTTGCTLCGQVRRKGRRARICPKSIERHLPIVRRGHRTRLSARWEPRRERDNRHLVTAHSPLATVNLCPSLQSSIVREGLPFIQRKDSIAVIMLYLEVGLYLTFSPFECVHSCTRWVVKILDKRYSRREEL